MFAIVVLLCSFFCSAPSADSPQQGISPPERHVQVQQIQGGTGTGV